MLWWMYRRLWRISTTWISQDFKKLRDLWYSIYVKIRTKPRRLKNTWNLDFKRNHRLLVHLKKPTWWSTWDLFCQAIWNHSSIHKIESKDWRRPWRNSSRSAQRIQELFVSLIREPSTLWAPLSFPRTVNHWMALGGVTVKLWMLPFELIIISFFMQPKSNSNSK